MARGGSGLPVSVTLDPAHSILRWLPPRDVAVEVEAGLGRFLEFACHGQDWHLPRRSEPLLRLMVGRREIVLEQAIGELSGLLDPDEVVKFIRSWEAKGLVEIVPGKR